MGMEKPGIQQIGQYVKDLDEYEYTAGRNGWLQEPSEKLILIREDGPTATRTDCEERQYVATER